MTLTNATQAIEFVTMNGAPNASKATLADAIGRAIASRYEYLKTWGDGRSMTRDQEADMYECIGVLRLEFFRLAGRAFLAA